MENNMMELVKELRVRTHLGLTECKKALEESEGDIEKAIEALQKKGLKKVDDLVTPTEGVVRSVVLKDGLFAGTGFIVEINCQTDFGAKSDIFQKFVENHMSNPNLSQGMLNQHLNLVTNQLGEKIVIRRSTSYECTSKSSLIVAYNHMDKIAVLLEADVPASTANNPKEKAIDSLVAFDILENLAMQIAANKPLALDRNSLPAEVVEKKKAFYEDEVKFKPEQVRGKILSGKMDKWYSEVTLIDQDAIFLPEGAKKEKVSEYLNRVAPEVKLIRFVRYERGEAT